MLNKKNLIAICLACLPGLVFSQAGNSRAAIQDGWPSTGAAMQDVPEYLGASKNLPHLVKSFSPPLHLKFRHETSQRHQDRPVCR